MSRMRTIQISDLLNLVPFRPGLLGMRLHILPSNHLILATVNIHPRGLCREQLPVIQPSAHHIHNILSRGHGFNNKPQTKQNPQKGGANTPRDNVVLRQSRRKGPHRGRIPSRSGTAIENGLGDRQRPTGPGSIRPRDQRDRRRAAGGEGMQQDLFVRPEVLEHVQHRLEFQHALAGGLEQEMHRRGRDDEDAGGGE